jgi:peptidyl-prolyl cis-trans isomerase SurA
MNLFKQTKNYLSFVFIFLMISSISAQGEDVKIVMKINNEIITNIDIENEYNYLIALNKNLENIEKEKIFLFAKQSLVKEKIKKLEIIKYFELNKKNQMVDGIIKNIYRGLDINNEKDFKNYLQGYNLKFNDVYKKIEIETVWNQIIYNKYKNKIVINEENLKKKILNNPQKKESVLLSELIFDFENKNEINAKYQNISKSINDIGFKETVIKFSIADSKSNFGSLGWVNINILSQKIKKELEDLSIGEFTKPIVVPSGMLVLKLDDKKIEDEKVDLNKELETIIKFETNAQLNNFSIIYFNKVKNYLSINEY